MLKYVHLLMVALAGMLMSCDTLESLAGEVENKMGGGYMAGVGGGAGVNTDLNPEDRIGASYWDCPQGLDGPRTIVVDRKVQRVDYYINKTLVGYCPMSSGKEGFATPAGTYSVIQKVANYRSNTYGVLKSSSTHQVIDDDFDTTKKSVPAGAYYEGAEMPYFMRFHGGYGMHVGVVTGYAVSHGCIRLPAKMAKQFFDVTPLGTKVIVK